MPAWDLFLAVTLLTLGALLVLARLSQDILEEYGPPEDEESTDSEGVDTFDTEKRSVDDREDANEETTSLSRSLEKGYSDTVQPERDPADGYDDSSTGQLDDSSIDQPEDSQSAESEGFEGPHSPDSEGIDDSWSADSEEIGDSRSVESEEFDDPPGAHQSEHDPMEEIELTPGMLMANVALTQAIVVVVLVFAAWYFDIPAEAFGITAESISTGLPAVAIGVAFGVVLWIANELSTTLADAVGAAYDERVRELLAPESPQGWVALFGVVLPLIAVAEELLFRAALIGVPEAGYGINVWLLAVGSSVAFALGHGAQGRVGVIVTGALGLVLAAGYVVTGSLLVVIVAHYVINALEFFIHEFLGYGDLFSDRITAGVG